MNPPKVFVSHATEDKERFVLSFATKLREKGIDAWLDKWEMLLGDSLADKIFEEGIPEAQAMIIVLSEHSIKKPWVKEELDAAMVRKINNKIRLIPIIIDNCQIPKCLEHILWHKINDTNSYENEFHTIVSSIYGQHEKPPLGNPPVYTQTIIDISPELAKIDNLIFKISCEKAIEKDDSFIEIQELLDMLKPFNINEEDMKDSLEILNRQRYIEAHRTMPGIIAYEVKTLGFHKYAQKYVSNYENIIKEVAFQIINHKKETNYAIFESLNHPRILINNILYFLQSENLIELNDDTHGGDGRYIIIDMLPEFKRYFT